MYDLLLAKKGIAAPSVHPLRVAVERHKARISAEFTKSRIRRGLSSVEELRRHVQQTGGNGDALNAAEGVISSAVNSLQQWSHPRWVRVNVLKTTLDKQLATTFAEYTSKDTLLEILETETTSSLNRIYHVDKHIPNLIALPPSTQLSALPAYHEGLLILQDKASCFPAYLLDFQSKDGDCLDACAAPGNKTTHLAAILRISETKEKLARIWACERDKSRANILQRMVRIAGADGLVTIKAGQDFLRIDASKEPWSNIGALLLDPSCSGSGIIGRNEALPMVLPSRKESLIVPPASKKRKRKHTSKHEVISLADDLREQKPIIGGDTEEKLHMRLVALQEFQTRLLLHALSFPRARKVTYSTCSIHVQENEDVILKALASPTVKDGNWRILPRGEQVEGMKAWPIRGDVTACREGMKDNLSTADEVAQACIRCHKGTREGTQGFFVAAFVKGTMVKDVGESDAEWEGCED